MKKYFYRVVICMSLVWAILDFNKVLINFNWTDLALMSANISVALFAFDNQRLEKKIKEINRY